MPDVYSPDFSRATLAVGSRVRLRGLKSRPELNFTCACRRIELGAQRDASSRQSGRSRHTAFGGRRRGDRCSQRRGEVCSAVGKAVIRWQEARGAAAEARQSRACTAFARGSAHGEIARWARHASGQRCRLQPRQPMRATRCHHFPALPCGPHRRSSP